MAEVAGLSKATISRIWRTFGLQSHRLETFKLSADPQFVEKVRDIVGLYLNPPDHALVLCLDEKSQVQALDRTRPLLPMRPGIPGPADARLHSAWHHLAVCRAERGHRARSSGTVIGGIGTKSF